MKILNFPIKKIIQIHSRLVIHEKYTNIMGINRVYGEVIKYGRKLYHVINTSYYPPCYWVVFFTMSVFLNASLVNTRSCMIVHLKEMDLWGHGRERI